MVVAYLTDGQEHSNGVLVIPTATHGALQAETSYNQYDEFSAYQTGKFSFLEQLLLSMFNHYLSSSI